jgi:hypothetical protein
LDVQRVDNLQPLSDPAQHTDESVSPVNKRRPAIKILNTKNPISLTKSSQPPDDGIVSPVCARRLDLTVTDANNPATNQRRKVESSNSGRKKESPMFPDRTRCGNSVEDGNKVDDSEGQYYPLVDLQQGKVSGIDIACREQYLSPVEFMQYFKMSKENFAMLPKWKRDKTKRSLKLF